MFVVVVVVVLFRSQFQINPPGRALHILNSSKGTQRCVTHIMCGHVRLNETDARARYDVRKRQIAIYKDRARAVGPFRRDRVASSFRHSHRRRKWIIRSDTVG